MTNDLARMNAERPAHLQQPDLPRGTEAMGQYVVLPRLKIVQPVSRGDFMPGKVYNAGDVVLVPQRDLLLRNDGGADGAPCLAITPLFFFVEYLTLNPIQLAGTVTVIRARSFDPNSEIARKSRDPQAREEAYPGNPQYKLKHSEHLNFASILRMEGFERTPVVLTFARAEHYAGRTFTTLIQMRNAPLYGCNFVAVLKQRQNNKGVWFGLDMTNPPADSGVSPWVDDAAEFEAMKELHVELAEMHRQQMLLVPFEEEEEETEPNGHGAHDNEAF